MARGKRGKKLVIKGAAATGHHKGGHKRHGKKGGHKRGHKK